MRLFPNAFGLLLVLFLTGVARADIAPMFVADSSRRLLTVDVLTGEVELIGSLGVQLTDVAFGHDGRLFGVNAEHLYEIDLETAEAVLIGSHGFGEFGGGSGIDALTFGADGVLYAAGDDVLISLDPATGLGTLLGTLSGYQSSGDLAVDSLGRLLLTTDVGDLIEVDPGGSGAVLIGSLPNVDLYTFAGGADGILYGIRSTDGIVTVNPATGAATPIGVLDPSFPIGAAWGGSFPDQFAPEPATLLLALVGGLLILRRRSFPSLA